MLWWQISTSENPVFLTRAALPIPDCPFIGSLVDQVGNKNIFWLSYKKHIKYLFWIISVENAKASNKTYVSQLIVSITNLVVYFSRQWKGDPVQKNCQRVSWTSLAQRLYLTFQLFHTNSNTLTTFDKKVTDPTSPTFRLEHFWGLK